jgi:DNA-binding IclR family transcriptional regulator
LEERYINKSLQKAFSILEFFSPTVERLSATEIARRLGTVPGVIYPILYTLERYGYLARDGNKKYSLGLKFLERGNLILQQLDLRDKAKPYLRELANTYNVNAHLAVLYGWKVMYLHREEGYPTVIIKEVVGQQVPAYCTALGKVLLASLDEQDFEAYLAQEELKPLTPKTISDPMRLREELKRVRAQGYAIDNEEFHEGNMCVAAPIRNHLGKTLGAISVSFPKERFLKGHLRDSAISEVVNNALKISRELGYSEGMNLEKSLELKEVRQYVEIPRECGHTNKISKPLRRVRC